MSRPFEADLSKGEISLGRGVRNILVDEDDDNFPHIPVRCWLTMDLDIVSDVLGEIHEEAGVGTSTHSKTETAENNRGECIF